MNPNLKKLIDAMRSGEYKQTQLVLTETYKGKRCFCAEGLACYLYLQDNPNSRYSLINGKMVNTKTAKSSLTMPKPVVKWLGWKSRYFNFKNRLQSIAGLNDSGKTFGQIADILEKLPANKA